MLFNAKFITLASLLVVVVSQTPSPCVLSCSQDALGSATNKSCTSIADPCVCTDMGFQAADGACLQANCTAADQAAAAQAQKAFCAGASGNTTTASETGSATGSSGTASGTMTTMSGSATMSGNMTSMTTTPSSSKSSASGSGSAASPSTSSGAGPQAEFGFLTLGVAAAGAVVGGLFI